MRENRGCAYVRDIEYRISDVPERRGKMEYPRASRLARAGNDDRTRREFSGRFSVTSCNVVIVVNVHGVTFHGFHDGVARARLFI